MTNPKSRAWDSYMYLGIYPTVWILEWSIFYSNWQP